MKVRILAAVCVVAISGCATSIPEMRDRGPQKSFTSQKSEQEVAECILFAWQDEAFAGVRSEVTLQPRPGGGKSVVNEGQREMADVIGGKNKTKVEFFTNGGGMSWISVRRAASIKPCL
ncbi:MAG: hypothetical protein ABIO21_10450 [Pseudomonas sp.]